MSWDDKHYDSKETFGKLTVHMRTFLRPDDRRCSVVGRGARSDLVD